VEAGPRRHAARQSAVVVAAGIVRVPEQRLRIKTVLREPGGKRQPIERFILDGKADVERYGEAARRTQRRGHLAEAAELLAVVSCQPDRRFNAFLPSSVDEQALLLCHAQMPL